MEPLPFTECIQNMKAKKVQINLGKSQLGESPCWHDYAQRLYWTDIEAKLIYRLDLVSGKHKICAAPKMAAFVLPTKDGELIAGLEDGLYSIDFATGNFQPIILLNEKGVRLNDGKCDPAGRIWFGTMALDQNKGKQSGKLYMFDGNLNEMDRDFGIANGKAWAKQDYFYHADTASKTIWRYRYDRNTGGISEKKAFIQMDVSPDGMCIDTKGNLYIAIYGEGRADIYAPSGIKKDSIEVAAKEVTSCAFGGADLKTLYITTAKNGLFGVVMDVAGVAETPVTLSGENHTIVRKHLQACSS